MARFLSKHGIIFDAIWTEFLDEQFFSWMQTEAIFHKRRITSDDTLILSYVTDWMNTYGSAKLSLQDICERFELAVLRFETWKALTNHNYVEYDYESLSISTTLAVWDTLCKDFELGTHYRHYPMERMWHELNSLFSPDEARRASFIATLPPKPNKKFTIKIDPLPAIPMSTLPTIDEILLEYEREEKEWQLRKKGKAKAPISPAINHYPFDRESSTKGKGRIVQTYGSPTMLPRVERQDDGDVDDDDEEDYYNLESSESSVWPIRNAKRNLGL